MRKYLFYLGLLMLPVLTWAQKDSSSSLPKRNTIYLEAFGQGLLNSLSYDRLYCTNKIIKSSVSAGVTYLPGIGIGDMYAGAQLSFNFLYTIKNHHIDRKSTRLNS